MRRVLRAVATTSGASPTSPAAACRATCHARCPPSSARASTRALADAFGDLARSARSAASRSRASGDVQRRHRDGPRGGTAAAADAGSRAARGGPRGRGGAGRGARRPLRRRRAAGARPEPEAGAGASRSASRAPAATSRARRGGRRGELGGEIALVFADRACPALDWAAEQGIETALLPGSPRPSGAAEPTRAGRDSPRGIGRARRPRRATCASSGRRRSRRSPADREHPPGAAAGVPGRPRRPRRPRPRREGHRLHRPPGRRDARRRPDRAPRRPSPSLPGDDEATLHERIKAVEHRLLPRAVALLLAGAVPVEGRRTRSTRPAPMRRSRAAAGAPLGQRQAGPRRLGRGPRRSRLRARLDRRDGARAARGRSPGDRCRGGHRLPGDARRPGEDAPSGDPRRHPRRSAPAGASRGARSPPGSRRSSSSS